MSSEISNAIQSELGKGQTLPQQEKDYFEPKFGKDFSEVKIHDDSKAHDLADSINAKAFTVGNDIFMGKNEHQINNQEGKELMAHELTHSIQQKTDDSILQKKENFEQLTNAHKELSTKSLEDEIGEFTSNTRISIAAATISMMSVTASTFNRALTNIRELWIEKLTAEANSGILLDILLTVIPAGSIITAFKNKVIKKLINAKNLNRKDTIQLDILKKLSKGKQSNIINVDGDTVEEIFKGVGTTSTFTIAYYMKKGRDLSTKKTLKDYKDVFKMIGDRFETAMKDFMQNILQTPSAKGGPITDKELLQLYLFYSIDAHYLREYYEGLINQIITEYNKKVNEDIEKMRQYEYDNFHSVVNEGGA